MCSWTAVARLEAVIGTASMGEADRSAWCREQGIFPSELERWRASAVAALAQPEEARASAQETRSDRRPIMELERQLQRKDKALAETAALLVLSKNSRRFSGRARTNGPSRESPTDGSGH